ncbi:hypothetical protein cypCar_00047390, partial [Cyprinus carpio]
MKMEYPKKFFPLETTCQLCTGHPALAEAVLITKKAKIVSMMGLIDRSADNPFTFSPSYEHWAPWIASETRRSGTVLNTEFKKVRTCPSSAEAQLSSVTEDHLIDELAKQKVGVVRKLCRACNIDTKGSRLDLITRLKENMKSRQTYDKVSYVLDKGRPAHEIIIKDGPTCLTRENLLSLGLNRQMDSMVGNACLRLVKEGVELQGLPLQHFGIDCGVFMVMTWQNNSFLLLQYAWYITMEAAFDFTIYDMPYLRSWWCKVLLENLEIE